jgi:hypothetical protein
MAAACWLLPGPDASCWRTSARSSCAKQHGKRRHEGTPGTTLCSAAEAGSSNRIGQH